MQSFTIRDLRERPGELSHNAEQGQLSLVTKHGRPLFVSVPFTSDLVSHGIYVALAENLYKSGSISLGKAAKLARQSIPEFTEHLSQLGIPIVDYDRKDLEDELTYFNK